MLKKPLEPCSTCPLWKVTHSLSYKPWFHTVEGEGFCEPEGHPYLGVTFIAEASGQAEEEDGLPLRPYAQAGAIHTRILRSLYASRKQVAQFNVIACRPPNNELSGKLYEHAAIACCKPLRDERIKNARKMAEAASNVKRPVIVALGDVAFSTLTGYKGDKKNKLSISYLRGYPIETQEYGLVIGTFHPAYVRRNTKLMGVVTEDYRKAFKIAREGLNPLPKHYLTNPTTEEKRDFRDRVMAMDANDPLKWLIFDFETPEEMEPDKPHWWRPMSSAQFSFTPGSGIFLSNHDDSDLIREILASPCKKAGHNVLDFDVPLAAHNNMPIAGRIDDTLWMFHHYQPDLTMEEAGSEAGVDFRFSTAAGLQYVASLYGADTLWKYKRLDEDKEVQKVYGVEDVDNNARIIYGCNGYESLPSQLKSKNLWHGYERYVRDFFPILQKMAARGIPINREKQLAMVNELHTIEIKIDAKIQKIHPDELKRLDPKEGFKNGPKEGEKVRRTAEGWEWFDADAEDVSEAEFAEMDEEGEGDVPVVGVWRPMVERVFQDDEIKETKLCDCLYDPKERGERKKGLKAFGGKRPDPSCPCCSGRGKVKTTRSGPVVRWARLLPFRPSNKQLVAYINHRKHKVPYDRKTRKNTTAAKGIAELVKKTKDPLYQSILDIRTLQKVSSTYLTGRGWIEREWIAKERPSKRTGAVEKYYVPGPIRPLEEQPPRIYTTPSMGPATGQTAMRRPNVQNVPKHIRNENLRGLNLPKKFRSLIEARPGHQIWELDLKSAHALTLGLEARSANYMRLARMDVHSYFTSVLAHKRGLWPRPIDLNVSDADLKKALKEVRSYVTPSGLSFEADIRDVQAKPTILGIGFGMMGYKLWETNKEAFINEFDAQETIDVFFSIFPELKRYQDAVLLEAHDNGYLASRGGFIRWFHEVFKFAYDPMNEGKFKMSHGADAEDAKAFRPSNTAFVYMRDAQLRLEEKGINEYANFINVIHDSNMFELPDDGRPTVFYDTTAIKLEDIKFGFVPVKTVAPLYTVFANSSSKSIDVARLIKEEMEKPQPALCDPIVAPDGLWIGCDVKSGPDWGHMEDVKL